ncbi:MAG: XRE family transcriptional regulator [Lachnospiraceae bacterium]|nr:XRE family transcriptional regulator [Lachnospiraceae bacterium]
MNSYIIEKLKEGRVNAKLKQSEVAEMIGIKGNTLSNYENGVSEPDIDTFCALCDIYNIDPSNILNEAYGLSVQGEDFKIRPSEIEVAKKYRFISTHSPDGASVVDTVLDREYEIAKKLKEQKEQLEKIQEMELKVAEEIAPTRIINYYYRLASAGTGQIIFDMPPTKRIEIPDLPEYRTADYAIGVNGNSMEPTYYDGDTLLVEMTEQIEIGEIGIFSVNNECFVKKLGHDELISLNPASKNIPLNETARCMGRVIGKATADIIND